MVFYFFFIIFRIWWGNGTFKPWSGGRVNYGNIIGNKKSKNIILLLLFLIVIYKIVFVKISHE